MCYQQKQLIRLVIDEVSLKHSSISDSHTDKPQAHVIDVSAT